MSVSQPLANLTLQVAVEKWPLKAPFRITGYTFTEVDVVIATISCARAYGPFNPDRPHPKELRQLWFGAGPHFCLGMPLAKAEIDAVLGMVLDLGGVRVVSRRAARRVLIPGYRSLVVRR